MATYDMYLQMQAAFGSAFGPSPVTWGGASFTAGATDDTIYGTAPTPSSHSYTDFGGNTYLVSDYWYGSDTLRGGAGSDTIYGGQEGDVLNGDDGDDLIQGNQGNDNISGDAGNDQLYGGQGQDVIYGGAGNDFISGDLSNDTIYGGSGADTIYIGSATIDTDHLLDFNYSEGDRVRVAVGVSYTLAQSGADVVVQLGGAHQLIVANQTLATLPSDWIFT